MRRLAVILTAFVILTTLLISGCGSLADNSGKIKIVCTNFPIYDWVNEVIDGEYSDKFEVILLGGNGDLHSYQPTAQDIATIQTCNLFIYVGGMSDGWTKDALRNSKAKTLKLFDALGGELLCSDHGHGEHNHKEEEYDEHIWLSPVTAEKAFEAVASEVSALMPEGKDVFDSNVEKCKVRFRQIDRAYRTAVENSEDKTIVFADRFPFLYLTEEYGINAVAAFPGCSADSNANFDVIAQLVETMNNEDKKTVLVLEKSNQSVADTVIKNTGKQDVNTEVMNSCQAIGKNEISQGADYFDIMEKNLDALKKALE